MKITDAQIELMAAAAWNLHANVPWAEFFKHDDPRKVHYLEGMRAAVYALEARAPESIGKSMGAHYGVELTPSEIEAEGLDEVLRDRLEDAAHDIAYHLAAGGDEDMEPHDREVREHILAHAKHRGLKVSIHIHDPLRMAPVTG